ncbi:MAG: hypothetical protein WCA12_15335, partial [Burkholderiales bacterium]
SPGMYEWRILAEGDSWFSIGAIPSSNLLWDLELERQAAIVNIAYPGDVIVRVAAMARNPDLRTMLVDERRGWQWHAILLSGGGNDLIDAADRVVRLPASPSTDADDYIDKARLADLVRNVQRNYRQIVALRDSGWNRQVPIVTHTYDYATPRNSGAKFFGAIGLAGPWLHRAFEVIGVPKRVRVALADRLLDALSEAILALGRELPAFHVVETRRTLVRADPAARDESGDWLNEIDPNATGYRKLGRKIADELRRHLPVPVRAVA